MIRALPCGDDRHAIGEEACGHQPAVGGEHGGFACDVGGWCEQVGPAVWCAFDQIGAITQAGGAPSVGHRESVAGIVAEFVGFGVEIFQVGNFSGVDGGEHAELVQSFGKGRRYEEHVEAFAAGGRNLAHDFFIGGVNCDFEINACGGFELLADVFGHIAIPVRHDDFLGHGEGCGGQEHGGGGHGLEQ